jgi:uncharacterized repeat protein (TIGR03803 family)
VVFTTLHPFRDTDDGALPKAGLVQGSDGYFYGTTEYGGTTTYNIHNLLYGYGTVFKIGTSGALTNFYSFIGTNDGVYPTAGLVQGSNGYFYGTIAADGYDYVTSQNPYGYGGVFEISTNGLLTRLYSFTGGNDGASPCAGLVQGSDGYLYGTTQYGGTNGGYGTVFKITTNGALTTLYSFTGFKDGSGPSGLVQGSDGYFYGTTVSGGPFPWGWGTVFKISTNGALTTLYAFGTVRTPPPYPPVYPPPWPTPLDGAFPNGLVEGQDGSFYGTTGNGGPNTNYGTVFRISTNGALTTLYSFTGGNDGANPYAGLVQGRDGSFFGTTSGFGLNFYNNGTVFKITPGGALTTLHSFTGGTDGEEPVAGLVQGSNGSFYGTTCYGGTTNILYPGICGYGTVFRLTIVPPPQLTLIPSGPYVILTWPTNYAGFDYTGYTLESTTDLGSSAVWTTNSQAPVVVNGQNVVTNSITGTQQFFRLIQ